jgi:multidrug efflux pump subunit AcrB
MQWLAEVCVKRPVFTWVLMLTLVVVGGVSFLGLGVDRFPNIDVPIVAVSITQRGASPAARAYSSSRVPIQAARRSRSSSWAASPS